MMFGRGGGADDAARAGDAAEIPNPEIPNPKKIPNSKIPNPKGRDGAASHGLAERCPPAAGNSKCRATPKRVDRNPKLQRAAQGAVHGLAARATFQTHGLAARATFQTHGLAARATFQTHGLAARATGEAAAADLRASRAGEGCRRERRPLNRRGVDGGFMGERGKVRIKN